MNPEGEGIEFAEAVDETDGEDHVVEREDKNSALVTGSDAAEECEVGIGGSDEKTEGSCQPNRFVLSFQDTTLLGDTCLDESRIKCRAFWTFIDASLTLKTLIKEGHDLPSPPNPPCYDACDDRGTRQTAPCFTSLRSRKDPPNACHNLSQQIRIVRVLPIEIKYRADEERLRFRTRREAVKALQLKSGQPIVRAKPERPKPHPCLYADEIPEINLQ